MEDIKKVFVELANECIQSGFITTTTAIDYIYQQQPQFKNDIIFKQLFPTIFYIQLCHKNIKDNETR